MTAAVLARHEAEPSLVSLSLQNLWLIWPQVLAYIAVATVLGLGAPITGAGQAGLADLMFHFGGQYWLFRTLLRRRGLLRTEQIHIFAFVGLALLLIIPIMFGLVMLLIPGLFLVARWIAAPAFVAARGEGPWAAAVASFAAVRGQTGAVMSAIVVLVFVLIAIMLVLVVLDRALGSPADPALLNRVSGHFLPLMLLGLSVATYQRLGSEDTAIEDVFG